MKRFKDGFGYWGILALLLVGCIISGAWDTSNRSSNRVIASGTNAIDELDDMDINDFFKLLPGAPRTDPEKLIPPFTINVDEEAADFDGGCGYKSHVEVTYVLNKIWYNGPGIFANEEYIRLRTPAEYLQEQGGILNLEPGDSLPFRIKTSKGSGTGWNGDEKKTYKDSQTYDGDTPSALLTRTKTGARLLVHNPAIDDDGSGMLYNFGDLHSTVLAFNLTEADLKSCSKSFSYKLSSAEYQQKGTITATLTATLAEELQADFEYTQSSQGGNTSNASTANQGGNSPDASASSGITNPDASTSSSTTNNITYSGLERGEITLDASTSKGIIKDYTWTFDKPEKYTYSEGIQFDSGVELTGKIVKVVLLEPVEVTLKITDAKGIIHKKKRLLSIKPRSKFKTETNVSTGKRITDTPRITTSTSGGSLKSLALGRTVCADCYKDDSSYDPHYIHPKIKSGETGLTWEGEGYTIEEVSEGPFKGTYYVKDYHIKLNRKKLVNQHLWADDPGGKHCRSLSPDIPSFMKYNMSQKKSDWSVFIKSIWDHEGIHASLVKEAFTEANPDSEIEAKFGTDHDGLASKVDSLIGKLQGACEDKDQETTVLERLKKLYGSKNIMKVGLLTIIYEGNNVAKVEYRMYDVDIYDFDLNP